MGQRFPVAARMSLLSLTELWLLFVVVVVTVMVRYALFRYCHYCSDVIAGAIITLLLGHYRKRSAIRSGAIWQPIMAIVTVPPLVVRNVTILMHHRAKRM